MNSRLFLGLAACVLLASPAVGAEIWQLDPAHSAAQFAVRHLGISTVRGAFTKMSGTVLYDPSETAKSSIEVSIDTNSVDTRVEMRDNDLRGDHFFDTSKFPTMTFKSTKVDVEGPGHLKVTGDLTLHGVTKPVVLSVSGPTEPVKDPRGKSHMGASATTKINRSNFGMGNMQPMVGNEIEITIDVELVKPTAKP
jgi:polyisoprenoid-binding protein YceI